MKESGFKKTSKSETEPIISSLYCRLAQLPAVKNCGEVIVNLEAKFYVSSNNKSLYEYLKKGPRSAKERGFPLRKRMNF